MKEYKDIPEKEESVVKEPAVAYQITPPQSLSAEWTFKIPRDENGKPVGTPWEEVLEELYDDLSEHYGVDLRTL
ncbi:MAG: hypothetical protein EZS26_000597 [Candidatus Ordinivivax streblomastigis]|uniref:Uncharacterized protein n=1 Tax=Candidatus Ordinivivax streblomastigis TaxID=2540710 RepID=A0A5M8P4R0_9BACT|nr:MAG: hypothetical protein EZS26_000370 [Candidatus Ordinivivax streblomastigis]KAA6303437.1 MAG: hypothetical protein EZS26_000597 [Candidatus Ordinivivax streblomastigis]